VLPFANLSGDRSEDYFSDGMAEEVRAALAALGGLEVVARTSSEMLRNADAITAARRLSVANVVTGSVRRSPSTVRVSAQLVDGHDGIEQWSQSFDRPIGDILQIQSDIAANVAQALSVKLGRNARELLSLGGTNNPQAQDLVLQATAGEGDDSSEGLRQRLTLLERAIQLDPNYAEAYARKGLNQSLWANAWARNSDEKDRVDAEAAQAANRAIAIAPAMPLGHSILGLIYRNHLAMRRSLAELQRAAELPGITADALLNYALVLSQFRRQGEAESTIERAISMDPLNALPRMIKSWILYFGHRYPASIEAGRQALAIAPKNIRARSLVALSFLMLGRTEDTLRELNAMPPDDYRRLVMEATIAARAGRTDVALNAIPKIESRYGDAANYQIAQIYAQLKMADKAIAAFDAAWSKRDSGLGSMLVDPFVDPIRGDPRFSAIAKRLFA
jgi:TolB-like protein/Tfp pilus assembly protein PilF